MIIDSILRFEKISQIGQGQGLNSTVWLARDHQFDAELVVKEIDKTTFWNPNCFAEAQAVYATSHPNVVSVQYCCEEGNSAFIGMPYYPSGSLSDRLSQGPMPLSSFFSMAQDLLLGLGHIHSKGFIHLDIKPTNIFFNSRHRALIADFGQARQISSTGVVTAPPLYLKTMPPEALASGNVAYVSDIYHAGALFYRAVNGEADWDDQLQRFGTDHDLRMAITSGRFPDRNRFLPHVPKRLRKAIRKALDVDPVERFLSAAAFGTELGRIQIPHDWQVKLEANGGITWHAASQSNADLIVDLRKSASAWKVEAFTANGTKKRAKGRDTLWGTFTKREQALKHLKTVFESL